MSYVDDNLMSGEQVIHRARLHWGIFVGPAILLFIGVIITIAVGAAGGGGWGVIILLLLAIPAIRALIRYLTTEFAITSRRVIVKMGLIKRVTRELNHNRVESLDVRQGVIERIFDAGTIVVRGTGGTPQPVGFIIRPMEFRRNALETIDNSP